MVDSSYPPPNVTPPANTSYPPPNVQPAAPSQGPPGYINSTSANPAQASGLSGAIEHHESGGKNVTSPVGAQGPRQIMPGTFKQFALPGENINNPADNRAVGDRILNHYLQIYHGDAARAAVAYFSGPGNVSPPGSPTPWIRNTGDGNNTVSQYVAATAGRVGAYTGTPAPSTPGTSINTTTPAQAAGIGAMWGALGADTGQGLKPTSTMDNLGRMVSDTPSSPNTYQTMANLQLQQAAAPGNARQAQIAGQAAQLAATLQQHAAQPLSWSTHPFGSTAGPQVPGTTLTSMGGSTYG